MTETMQRWSMDALGRDNLKLIQAPVPQPGPGEVRVRVNALRSTIAIKWSLKAPCRLRFPSRLRRRPIWRA